MEGKGEDREATRKICQDLRARNFSHECSGCKKFLVYLGTSYDYAENPVSRCPASTRFIFAI